MIKMINILTVAFLLISCNSSTKNDNILESMLLVEKDSIIESKTLSKMLLTTSSRLEFSEEVKLFSSEFTIVLNNSGDTIHWSTTDHNFKTPEGFSVGTNWNQLPIELQNSIKKMTGWGYILRLNSKWQLGFCEGPSCTDMKPKDGSYVKWIFKRTN